MKSFEFFWNRDWLLETGTLCRELSFSLEFIRTMLSLNVHITSKIWSYFKFIGASTKRREGVDWNKPGSTESVKKAVKSNAKTATVILTALSIFVAFVSVLKKCCNGQAILLSTESAKTPVSLKCFMFFYLFSHVLKIFLAFLPELWHH